MNDQELKQLLKENNWKITYSFHNGGLVVAIKGYTVIVFYNRKDKYREDHVVKTGIKKRILG